MGPPKNMKILDFGCGIGLCLGHMVENFRNSKKYLQLMFQKKVWIFTQKKSIQM